MSEYDNEVCDQFEQPRSDPFKALAEQLCGKITSICGLPHGHTGEHEKSHTESEHQAALALLREPMECGHPKACRVEQAHRVMVNLPDEPARSEPVFRCSACDQRDAALGRLGDFAQEATGHRFEQDINGSRCTCGKVFHSFGGDASNQWQQHILALADPQALTEHDAALAQKLLTSFTSEEAKKLAALEADNAALREQIAELQKGVNQP
jgi:hypothetical protein